MKSGVTDAMLATWQASKCTKWLLKRAEPEPNTGCWLWLGALSGGGYGRCGVGGEKFAHRVAYMLSAGAIPRHLEVDHRCRMRSCVNPRHLRLLTHAENMAHRTRPTACPAGHPYVAGNIYLIGGTRRGRPRNERRCRICVLERARLSRSSA